MDASTRRLRYFVAVAEELSFTRAAARVYVAQQALSRHVRELESDLGVTLLHRSTRHVELTAAGSEFLEVCRRTLEEFDHGVRAVSAHDRGERGRLRLGFFVLAALELTTPILKEFGRACPDAQIAMQEYSLLDPSAGLASGESELAIVRLPIATPQGGAGALSTEPLFVEPRVAAVAVDHPLAQQRTVTVAEVLQHRLTASRGTDVVYRDFWTFAGHARASSLPPIETSSHVEELEIVATGRACSITAASAARFTPHAGVRFVPLSDAAGVTCALAWLGRPSPLAARFVDVARQVRDASPDLVRGIEHPHESGDAPSGPG